MRQDPATWAQPRREGERGIALVAVMFFTMLMVMLGATLLTSSRTETQISANQLSQTQAFYIAEAGLAQAKAWLDANQTDAELMSALLVESQNANPDQSSLTRPDLTVVATPLGTQDFGIIGLQTYYVVIRDNNDDADPLTDSDSQWVITSRGDGPANASKFIEMEVLAAPSVNLNGALTASTPDFELDIEAGWDGQPPPSNISGAAHDLAGNPIVPGPSCPAQPALATDGDPDDIIDELNEVRKELVEKANEGVRPGRTARLPDRRHGLLYPGVVVDPGLGRHALL